MQSMPRRFSASSAQRNASLRAAASPSACSRVMWMSGTGDLLQFLVALLLREFRQFFRRIIKLREVASVADEQSLEAGHQVVVGGLRAERGVVRLRHPTVVRTIARRIAGPARLQLLVLVAELAHLPLL